MKAVLRSVLLNVAKRIGLFALARRLTATRLRILCYHGGAIRDENAFRPGLFMAEATFARRMRHLAEGPYHVIPLEAALDGLDDGGLPDRAVVITIDDGWYGTYRVMAPVLQRLHFPATLYIASYYLEKQTQVFNVATDYALWRAGRATLELASVDPALRGRYDLADPTQREAAAALVKERGEALDDARRRQELWRKLCSALGIDWQIIESERIVSYMSPDEARALRANGVDIQLHTHRHRLPRTGFGDVKAELEDNRRALSRVTDRPLRHFCYPSGMHTPDQIAHLERLGIASATTTDPGFNRPGGPRLRLRRLVDSDIVTDIEFEAEMSGLLELGRRLRTGPSVRDIPGTRR